MGTNGELGDNDARNTQALQSAACSPAQCIGKNATAESILPCPDRAADDNLVRREQEFSLAFENALDAIFWADADTGTIIRVNRAAEDLMGRPRSELLGMSQMDLHPADKRERFRAMFEEHVCADGSVNAEAVVSHASGREIPVQISASVTRIHDRSIIQGVFRNIEETKKAQQALEAERRKFHTLLETTPAFICSLDESLSIRYANSVFRANFGDYENRKCHETLWGSPEPCEDCVVRKLFETTDPLAQASKECSDAFGRCFQVFVKSYTDETGEKLALVTGFDVSQQKQAETERDARTMFLNTLIDTIPAPVFYKDTDGRYLGCNTAFEEHAGMPRERLIGKTVFDLWPRELAETYHAADMKLLREHGRQVYEGQISNPRTGSRDVIFHKATFNNPDGAVGGLLGITLDITERKTMERRLAQQERFVSSILDSLNNNICIIDGTGCIHYTNAAWNTFAADNGGHGDYRSRNYLQICGDSARGGDAVAGEAAEGIRLVLAGELDEFRLEYPCHSPDQFRWFTMSVRPLRDSEAQLAVIAHRDITERKLAEDALQQSEKRFRAVLNNNPIGIFSLTPGNCPEFIIANKSLAAMFGRDSAESLHGDPFRVLFAIEQEHDDFISLLRRKGRVSAFECIMRRGDGSLLCGSITAQVQVKADKTFRCFDGTIEDITGRKSMEDEIRQNEIRLKDFMDNAKDLIQMIGAQGQFVFVNKEWRRTLGYSEDEARNLLFTDIIHPDHLEHCRGIFMQVMSGNNIPMVETVFLTKDGREIAVEGSVNCRFVNGEPVSTRAIFRNITERKLAEDALRQSEGRLRTITDTARDAIVMLDESGNISFWNPAAEAVFGYPPEEAIGKNLHQLLAPPEFHEPHAAAFTQFQTSGCGGAVGKTMELDALRKNGERFSIELSLAARKLPGGWGAVGIVRDITERRQAREKLQQAMHDLERSNRELEEFAYVASHDLKEPLRMVVSYMQLLERRYKGQIDEKADKFIGYAVDGALRMQKLISALLQYSRVGRVNSDFETVDGNALMARIADDLDAAVREKNASITYSDLPKVQAAPALLGQLLQNLVCNGLKYCEDPAPHVHVSAERGRGEWIFSVRDNGIGIPPEHHERIFKIFQRLHTRDEYQGTGIGLSVCKKAVEYHQGRIWVDSSEGRGATFFFSIPDRGAAAS